jgi:hypothetical protein
VDVYNNLYQSSLSECMLVIQQSKIRCGCWACKYLPGNELVY